MDFKETYNNTSEQIKLKFLNAIIKHNNDLQQEFINFSKQKDKSNKGISINSFLQKIEITQEQYLNHFNSVDLENPDWDNYNPHYSGYIEEWEQYQQASEQEFEQLFDYFKSDAIDKIIQQQIDDLTAMLLGLYEACLNAEIKDDVGSFDDVNEHLTGEHNRTMQILIEKIKISAISSNKVNSAIQLFFNYCDDEYPGNPTYPKYFEPFILALADISEQAETILSFIDASKVKRETLPQLVLLLNKKTGNNTDWLQSAKKYYKNDKEVAKQLLDYYLKADKNLFANTANELFNIDKKYWSRFLKEKISIKLDKTLFIKVFYELTIIENEIEYYYKIRDYLNPSDFKQLLSELAWNKSFVVKILEIEKKYEEIKEIVENNSESWSYEELIKPILNVYPEFCFNNIKEKTESTLANQRGRSAYHRIALWLQLAKNINDYQKKTQELILQLYNYKPNLPALKDEFRKAGLV